MLRIQERVLTVSEALCSLLSGSIVPETDSLSVTSENEETSTPTFTVRRARKPWKSLKSAVTSMFPTASTRVATQKPSGLNTTEWLENHLYYSRGVVACFRGNPSVAISKDVACGNPAYWLANIATNPDMFNQKKTRLLSSSNTLVFEANTLTSGVPPFVPEGTAFGLGASETDEFIDAGIHVTLRRAPYSSNPIAVEDPQKIASYCFKEIAYTMQMAEQGIAPSVLACFVTQVNEKAVPFRRHWGDKALAVVDRTDNSAPDEKPGEIASIVTVSQIATFTLADLMEAVVSASVDAKRSHLVGVLKSMCGPVFALLRNLNEPYNGHAMIKLNLDPNTIVFCPELVANGDQWELTGSGYMPISEDYLDGVPKLTDFNSLFTTRVLEGSHSKETSFVMHSLLLVAFAKARFGGFISNVLWEHLLSSDDSSGFLCDAKTMHSKPTNASSFLSAIVANSDMRESSPLSKALAEIVSDLDDVVRSGLISSDGSLSMPPSRSMFQKLVCLVTQSSKADTLIFDTAAQKDETEQLHLRALEEVKEARRRRLSASAAC